MGVMSELFDRRLSSIEDKLDKMVDTITKIAVQKERLDKIEQKTNAICKKWDKLVDPDVGMLPILKASVTNTKDRIDSMKWVVGLLGATSIGCTLSLFSLAYYVWKMAA